MIGSIIASLIGTYCFSILFSIPLSLCPYGAGIGALGWAVYLLFNNLFDSFVATMVSTMVIVFLSRCLAIKKKSPANLFLIAGIFPLVPGAGIYNTVYYLIEDELLLALNTGYQAITTAIAIVLGIVFVFELPQRLFNYLMIKD